MSFPTPNTFSNYVIPTVPVPLYHSPQPIQFLITSLTQYPFPLYHFSHPVHFLISSLTQYSVPLYHSPHPVEFLIMSLTQYPVPLYHSLPPVQFNSAPTHSHFSLSPDADSNSCHTIYCNCTVDVCLTALHCVGLLAVYEMVFWLSLQCGDVQPVATPLNA